MMTASFHGQVMARYHHVQGGGFRASNAAWSYPLPSPLAWMVKGHVAFEPSKGIVIRDK